MPLLLMALPDRSHPPPLEIEAATAKIKRRGNLTWPLMKWQASLDVTEATCLIVIQMENVYGIPPIGVLCGKIAAHTIVGLLTVCWKIGIVGVTVKRKEKSGFYHLGIVWRPSSIYGTRA